MQESPEARFFRFIEKVPQFDQDMRSAAQDADEDVFVRKYSEYLMLCRWMKGGPVAPHPDVELVRQRFLSRA